MTDARTASPEVRSDASSDEFAKPWAGGLDPEVRRLVEAAASSQGRDSIGHQATAELLRRGFPDALHVPPEALDAYWDANTPRRLWIPFLVHYAPVSLGLFLYCAISVADYFYPPTDPFGFVLSDHGGQTTSLGDAVLALFWGGGWIALGAYAAFAPPQSPSRPPAAFLVGFASLLGVLGIVLMMAWPSDEVARITPFDFGDALALALWSAWLLAPAFLAFGSLRGDR